MAGELPSNGLTTKEVLLQVLSQVQAIDKKVDEARDSQIRTETILAEGRFGERLTLLEAFRNKTDGADERLTLLEAFRNRTEGALGLAKWAVGGSGIALILGIVSLYVSLNK